MILGTLQLKTVTNTQLQEMFTNLKPFTFMSELQLTQISLLMIWLANQLDTFNRGNSSTLSYGENEMLVLSYFFHTKLSEQSRAPFLYFKETKSAYCDLE